MAALAKLKPAFETMAVKGGFGDIVRHRYPRVNRLNHVHTAGNSSGVVDGAAAMLIGSPALGKELGLKPRARFISFATVGCEPSKRLNTGVPFRWEYLPVRIVARLGVQIELTAKQRSSRVPSRASRSKCGVRFTTLP